MREYRRRRAPRAQPTAPAVIARYQHYLVAAFLSFLCVAMFFRGGFVGPEIVLLGLLLVSIFMGQALRFIRDWIPFMALFLSWQLLRGYADDFADGAAFPIHAARLVQWDEGLFHGHLPTVVLQSALFHPGQVEWYDLAATMLWAFQFAMPLVFAYFLWLKLKPVFWTFVSSLLLLAYGTFLTDVFYPSAPPWLASDWGHIRSEVYLINGDVLASLSIPPGKDLSWTMSHANPDLVASMPSMYAGVAMLVFWFSLFHWRKVAPFAGAYCLALWFGLVYTGNHYAVDVIAGALYGTTSYVLVHLALRLVSWRRSRAVVRRLPAKEVS